MTVKRIREICAREFNAREDYRFFQLNYFDGENPDIALMRLFLTEKRAQIRLGVYKGDENVVMTLCHG